MSTNQDIAVYDAANYDYSTFWKGREYEHKSEIIALNSLYSKMSKTDWFIDVGGSYGRLFDTYKDLANKKIILDYSILALQQAKERFQERDDVYLVAANVYNLPFRENSFELGQMIRVMHHLEDQLKFFRELERVLKSGANFILEFPNSRHIKNILRSIFDSRYREIYKKKAFEIPETKQKQGMLEDSNRLFLGYSLHHIEYLIKSTNLEIVKKRGVSILRIPLIKKFIPETLLLLFEKIYQKVSPVFLISPSVFLKLNNTETAESSKFKNLEDLLVCPRCKSSLERKKDTLRCDKCNNTYTIENGIYDLRYPIIEN
jgi:ubiquinone/menaquinone biosynthesis C-methylase UbiE